MSDTVTVCNIDIKYYHSTCKNCEILETHTGSRL
jgi:hypothetical protein